VSEAAAELICPSTPAEFLLYVPVDGVAYRSILRWREKDRVGIQFTGTEPKPKLHYGWPGARRKDVGSSGH
jgi:hypothetical protein